MNTMRSRVLGWVLLLTMPAYPCLASLQISAVELPGAKADLAARERQLGKLSVRNSNFSAVARTTRNSCEAVQPPEALATPIPLLDMPGLNVPLTVSFIVGTDGRVHSPLILVGLGPAEDRIVLDTLLSWRYRPATCNGVPTEAEGKIAFSSH